MTPQQAAQRLLSIQQAPKSFLGFVRAVHPNFDLANFQLELIDVLDALERQTLGKRNVLITMPPRHGKSWLASVLFPAYYILKKAERCVLAVSYGADLAQDFGRQVRDLTLQPIVHQAFPDFELDPTSTAIDDWRTLSGGRYYACGIGGGTTGKPANLLLIDDPIKNRIDAESPSTRNKAWNFYNSSLENRMQPEVDGTLPIQLLIQTRWHPDDVAGRMMETEDWKEGDWEHVNFQAIRKVTTSIKMSRSALPDTDPNYLPPEKCKNLSKADRDIAVVEDQALWPERFPLDVLLKRQRRDPREFAALYQQEPYMKGGNLVRISWFQSAPTPDRFQTLILACDTASKTKTQNDYSVIMALGLAYSGDIHIADIIREKLDYPALKRRIIQANAVHRGKGLRGIYIEDASSGIQVLQDLRQTPGLSIIPYKYPGQRGSSDKVSRFQSVMPLIEGGRVFMPDNAPWLDAFLEELQQFPTGKNDDMVDALAIGLDVLSRVGLSAQNSFSSFPDTSMSLNSMAASGNPMGNFDPNISKDTDRPQLQSNWLNFKPLGEL